MLRKDSDNYNVSRLKKYKLPVIKSINELLIALDLTDREKYFLFSENRKRFLYHEFTIPKKSGGFRLIEAPNDEIKPVLKAIDKVFFRHFELSPSCCAFLEGKSIVNNASPHKGAKTLLKFDIKDFFPSISFKRVVYLFRFFGFGINVSKYLALLCTNKNFCLPQGAPTSPMISNLVCVRLDARINGYCNSTRDKYGLKYTRYADDITLSTDKKLKQEEKASIKTTIFMILRSEGFEPNPKKCRSFTNGQKLEVTGVNVNDSEQTHVNKRIKREIEIAIHCIGKYGLVSHVSHINNKFSTNYSVLKYREHILGKAYFVKMVDKKRGSKYISSLKQVMGND